MFVPDHIHREARARIERFHAEARARGQRPSRRPRIAGIARTAAETASRFVARIRSTIRRPQGDLYATE